MQEFQRDFLDLAVAQGVLRFGEFTLKSGRLSPYFFNAGLFRSGASLARLGACYADAAEASGLAFDMLFGPAYKGIVLAGGHGDRRVPAATDATCPTRTTARKPRTTASRNRWWARRSRAAC
jgi:hypothetical protein